MVEYYYCGEKQKYIS